MSKECFSEDNELLKDRDRDAWHSPSSSVTPVLSRTGGKKIRLKKELIGQVKGSLLRKAKITCTKGGKLVKYFILYFSSLGHCLGSRASAHLIVGPEDKYLNDGCPSLSPFSQLLLLIIIMSFNKQYHFGHLSWLCPLPIFCPLPASWLVGERVLERGL